MSSTKRSKGVSRHGPRGGAVDAVSAAAEGIRGRIQLEKDGATFLGPGRVDLLQAIAQHGSISAAARAVGLSYKAAWDAVDAMNNRAEAPLVTTAIGGSGGGGTALTPYGEKVLALVRRIEADYADTLRLLDDPSHDVAVYQRIVRRLSLRTSARNQWLGTIQRVSVGLVHAEVLLSLGEQMELVATISSESVDELTLRPGEEVYALVKATAIGLTPGAKGPPAPNRWVGKVARFRAEPGHVAVTVGVPCGRSVTAIGTLPAEARLREGADVTVDLPSNGVTLVLPD
jgi:molybdate transport system regulatory protein